MDTLQLGGFQFTFSVAWTIDEMRTVSQNIQLGITLLNNQIGVLHSDFQWTIERIEDAQAEIANAVTVTATRQLYLHPNAPLFSIVHELFHVMHAECDFTTNIFEEGIAIAASTLSCRDGNLPTHFQYEDYVVNSEKILDLMNDPLVPLDQFLPLTPIRYSILGECWLDLESKHPGMLRSMTQLKVNFEKLQPEERLKVLGDYLRQFTNNEPTILQKWNTNREILEKETTILAYDRVRQALHIVQFRPTKTNLKEKEWVGSGTIDRGIAKRVLLRMSNLEKGGPVNEPEILTDESGHSAFSLASLPEVLGASNQGYRIVAHDANTQADLDAITIKL